MTDTQLHQVVSAAGNLHAMISSRMIHAVGCVGGEDVDTFADTEEWLAFIAACRLLNVTFNRAYDEAIDKT